MSEVISFDDCWLYAGELSGGGYGVVSRVRKSYAAHRVMYEELIGEIPEKLVLDHLCRTRSCINPKHLEPVTSIENIRRGVKYNAPRCRNGHPRTPENTMQRKDSRAHKGIGRQCLICHREVARRNMRKYRAAAKLKTVTER